MLASRSHTTYNIKKKEPKTKSQMEEIDQNPSTKSGESMKGEHQYRVKLFMLNVNNSLSVFHILLLQFIFFMY